jgi:osmotically-inducible protein OsmY
MKTEKQLKRDVEAELRWEPSVNADHIGVSVKDGVVELDGMVDSYYEKLAAGRAALRVAEVRAIANDLRVEVAIPHLRADADIARAAKDSLGWNHLVPPAVKVRVSDGWITLEGVAAWQFQKEAAEKTLHTLHGVTGVTNEIIVRPTVNSGGVKHKIEEALQRSAAIDASRITVEAAEGTVTLRGSVQAWIERDEAERATWAAPGVARVVNLIEID